LKWLVVARLRAQRDGGVLADVGRDRARRHATEDIATEVFFFPAAAHTRRTDRSRTRSDSCSGTTRRSIHPATRDRICRSSTTSVGASRSSTRTARSSAIARFQALTWACPRRAARRAVRRSGAARDQRLRHAHR
jgi:hypothetical protein